MDVRTARVCQIENDDVSTQDVPQRYVTALGGASSSSSTSVTSSLGEASLAHETACALRDLGDLPRAARQFERSVRTRHAATPPRRHVHPHPRRHPRLPRRRPGAPGAASTKPAPPGR
jgi:hypothetical protein